MAKRSLESENFIALNLIEGLGPVSIKKLFEHAGASDRIFSIKKSELREIASIPMSVAEKIPLARETDEYKREIEYIDSENIHVLCLNDIDYPQSLKEIYDPPAVIYYKGVMPGKGDIAAAVVGSRNCSLYGMRIAETLSADMARAGVTVISGMAKGIDSAAHRGALSAGGRTVAVMGTGFRHLYPEGSDDIVRKISRQGAVITEFPCDVTPTKSTFPRRNRIISGMSRGVLVVEAAKKSGAIITVDFALEQGKDVFAVPGQVGSVTSLGTNIMIQNGAKLVLSAKDILDEIAPGLVPRASKNDKNVASPGTLKGEMEIPEEVFNEMSKNQKNVLEAIPCGGRAHIDEIAQVSALGKSDLAGVLLWLEIKGIIRSLPGAVYERLAVLVK